MQVQKSASHYTEAARDEITLLTQIKDGDSTDSRHCVRLHDWFEHRGPHGLHICMVFEVRQGPSPGLPWGSGESLLLNDMDTLAVAIDQGWASTLSEALIGCRC